MGGLIGLLFLVTLTGVVLAIVLAVQRHTVVVGPALR
jgi:hypothetical protein